MSTAEITRYVVTIEYQESGLSNILELNSTMTNGGFSTSLSDSEGHPHELGTNSFGYVGALTIEEMKEKATATAAVALEQPFTVEVATLEAYLQAGPSGQ